MPPKGVIIFDLDDLLIMNVHWYYAGWKMFGDVMVRLGFSKYEDELVDMLNKFDEEGVKEHGFKKERFGDAMGETYDYYCQLEGIEPDPGTREGLVDIGLSVYRHKPIMYPRAKEVLRNLRDAGYVLYCVTKGDHDVQTEKLRNCRIDNFFETVHFVPLEKKEALVRIIEKHPGTDRDAFYFVGNSLKDDMRPAIELGIHAILIYEYTWDFDESEFEGMEKITRLDTLAQLTDVFYRK